MYILLTKTTQEIYCTPNNIFNFVKVLLINNTVNNLLIMSTPLGGGYIIFAFFAVRCPMSVVRCPASGVRCPASRMVSAHLKEKY